MSSLLLFGPSLSARRRMPYIIKIAAKEMKISAEPSAYFMRFNDRKLSGNDSDRIRFDLLSRVNSIFSVAGFS
jgi:hypothetical protein